MKYFWITIVALLVGIFDNSFTSLGSTNVLPGVIILSLIFLRRKTDLNLTFAFVYGLVCDLFIRSGIGIAGLGILVITWILMEIRENVRFDPVYEDIVFSALYVISLLVFLKGRFFGFNLGKIFASIDIIFIATIFLYIILFVLVRGSGRTKR